MSGQNGLSCLTCPMISCPAVVMTTVSGLKLEQTYPYLPSGEKIVMPGPFGTRDTGLFLKARAAEDGDIVLAANADPNLLAVRRKEGLMRRAADIGYVFDRVRCRIDKCHGVGADGHHGERAMIRRKSHPVHQELPAVERAEISGRRIAKANDAEQLVIGRINDRHGVGELVRRVEAVAMAYRDVWRVRGARSLSRKRGSDTGEQQRECEAQSHWVSSFSSIVPSSAANDVRKGGIHRCGTDPSCR